MPQEIRFALVGCGKIGSRHAIQMLRVGKLVAVCDIDRDVADHFSRQYSVPAYYNLTDLLNSEKDITVAAICTPNGLHAAQSISCLEKGIHVLCEKPMALTAEDCRKMITAAELSGRELIIVKQNRFNPPVMAVKEAIESGKLGKIYTVQVNCFWNRDEAYYKSSWRGSKDLDGGTLFTQFSHFIDIMYWLAGDVEEAQAFLSNLAHEGIIEFEDTGVINFKFKNGAIGAMNYSVNSFGKNMEGSITILAEKGTVKIGGEYLNTLEYQQILETKLDVSTGSAKANDYGNYSGSMSNHDKVYDNLVDALIRDSKINATGLDGLKTVEIIEKIYSSN